MFFRALDVKHARQVGLGRLFLAQRAHFPSTHYLPQVAAAEGTSASILVMCLFYFDVRYLFVISYVLYFIFIVFEFVLFFICSLLRDVSTHLGVQIRTRELRCLPLPERLVEHRQCDCAFQPRRILYVCLALVAARVKHFPVALQMAP